MTSNLDEKGLRSIVGEYDVFFLDIWGAETSMKKGFIALGWTALFLVGIFFGAF